MFMTERYRSASCALTINNGNHLTASMLLCYQLQPDFSDQGKEKAQKVGRGAHRVAKQGMRGLGAQPPAGSRGSAPAGGEGGSVPRNFLAVASLEN